MFFVIAITIISIQKQTISSILNCQMHIIYSYIAIYSVNHLCIAALFSRCQLIAYRLQYYILLFIFTDYLQIACILFSFFSLTLSKLSQYNLCLFFSICTHIICVCFKFYDSFSPHTAES